MNDHTDRMVKAEILTSQTYPIYEQRLISDPNNPFKFYDCMKAVLPG